MQIVPYLFFKGEAAAALAQYEAVGLGKVSDLSHFKDAPNGPWSGTDKADWIMHATLTGPGGAIMVSDDADSAPMKGFSLSIGLSDEAEAQWVFDALGQGGHVRMPMARQFWGATFGQLTDRFGVQWMVNCEPEAPAAGH